MNELLNIKFPIYLLIIYVHNCCLPWKDVNRDIDIPPGWGAQTHEDCSPWMPGCAGTTVVTAWLSSHNNGCWVCLETPISLVVDHEIIGTQGFTRGRFPFGFDIVFGPADSRACATGKRIVVGVGLVLDAAIVTHLDQLRRFGIGKHRVLAGELGGYFLDGASGAEILAARDTGKWL